MTDYLVDGSNLTSIANAIRTKGGTSAQLEFPDEFISAINAIPTGGGGEVEEKQVNFIDYDGTILYSYTAQEANALTELPSNPSHTGLTAQGWNWTLAQIKSQLTANADDKVWVGQSYTTASGKTEIDVHFDARYSPYLTIAVNGTITIDWGDNTTADTVTGTSLTTRKTPSHTYASGGDYTISISATTGSSFAFYCSSSYLLLRKDGSASSSRVYAACVQNIRLGTGITSISDYAFYYCVNLKSITIPNTVTSITKYAFYNCFSLPVIVIPNSTTQITERVFSNCDSLSCVVLPGTVTSIATYAFNTCRALRNITLPSSITSIGTYAFYSCEALSIAILPNSVTSVGENLFNSCAALRYVKLPSNATSIGASAFSSCYAITRLIVPSGVTSIGATAFANCYGMKEYHFQRTSPPSISSNTFNNIQSDCIIYVPYSADHNVLNAYKGASNWSSQSSKIQEEPAS
jgi:hypothetical protein